MAALVYASRRASCPFEVVLVASNDPEAEGLNLARAEGIETFAQSHKGMPRAEFDAIINKKLRDSDVEYVALAGYMRLLSPEFIAAWPGRILNIHPSLLPRYKGLDTHARALAAGDTVSGCSVHQVTAELDEGEVIGQIEVAVLPEDTPETLAARVLIAEHQLYAPVLAEFVTRKSSPEWQLQRIRERAMQLPEAEEGVSHGMASFGILKGKKFAYFTHNHHNDGRTALLVKISGLDEQVMLIEADSDRYFRPAYFGDGWIGIRLDQGDTDWDGIGDWLRKSWLAIAPPKLLRGFMAAEEF
jgi:formyltetrahydrofolate-dependent phosphoribosylglycinamide formyltransferase